MHLILEQFDVRLARVARKRELSLANEIYASTISVSRFNLPGEYLVHLWFNLPWLTHGPKLPSKKSNSGFCCSKVK